MKVDWLGTGAAGGVPLYGCLCTACARARREPEWARRPCSALIEAGNSRLLIDAGLMDLHQRFDGREALTAILLTHFHPDHVQGLFHLRWGRGEKIPVFAPPDAEGCADLYKHPGLLDFRELTAFAPFSIGELKVTPLPLHHSRPTFGYAIEDAAGARFAYLTDTLGLPESTREFLRAWKDFALALDCSFPPRVAPKNHNDWMQALTDILALSPRRAWLTHIGHELDRWLLDQDRPPLPSHIALARDDERIVIHPPPGVQGSEDRNGDCGVVEL